MVPVRVVISAKERKSLLETTEILSEPGNEKKIERARRELRAGCFLTHEQVWSEPIGRGDRARPKRRRATRGRPAAL